MSAHQAISFTSTRKVSNKKSCLAMNIMRIFTSVTMTDHKAPKETMQYWWIADGKID